MRSILISDAPDWCATFATSFAFRAGVEVVAEDLHSDVRAHAVTISSTRSEIGCAITTLTPGNAADVLRISSAI